MLFQPKVMRPRQRQAGVDGVTLREAIPQREKMWWSYPGLRTLNLLLLGAICCDVSNGYDSSMLNGLQILPQWSKYFHNPVDGNLGLINNGTRIGQVALVPLIGPILKRFGRRMPIIYGSLLLLVGIAIQTAAQNTAMFIMGRVVIGFGNAVQQAASLVLIAEVCFPSQRAAILGIMNSTNGIGQIMAAWVRVCLFAAIHSFSNIWCHCRLLLGQVAILLRSGVGDYRVSYKLYLQSSRSSWHSTCPNRLAGSSTTTGRQRHALFLSSTTLKEMRMMIWLNLRWRRLIKQLNTARLSSRALGRSGSGHPQTSTDSSSSFRWPLFCSGVEMVFSHITCTLCSTHLASRTPRPSSTSMAARLSGVFFAVSPGR